MKRKIILTILLSILIVCLLVINLIINNGGKVVYASTTNPDGFSEFDDWLMEEVGISATPAHIIIKDGKVVNSVDYCITPKEFKFILNDDSTSVQLYDKELYCIENESIDLSEYDVIYVTKFGCNACDEQQEEYEPEILKQNKKLNFLIYYINTEKENVQCLTCG